MEHKQKCLFPILHRQVGKKKKKNPTLFMWLIYRSKYQYTQYWYPSTEVGYTHKHQLHNKSILRVEFSATYFDCHCWFGQCRTYFTHRLILSAIRDSWAGGRHRGIWLWFGVLALAKWSAVDLKVPAYIIFTISLQMNLLQQNAQSQGERFS